MSCRSVRDWLHRDVESLDEAQRLRLDDHLASCETCRGDRARMRVLHEVGTSLDAPPEARAYTRAIARALMEGAPRRAAPQPSRGWMYAVAAAVAIGVAILIAVRVTRDRAPERRAEMPIAPAPTPAPMPAPEVVERVDVVEDGELRDADRTLTSAAPIPGDVSLIAASSTRLRLGSSHVTVAASSELRWQPVDRTLLLDRGTLDIATTTPLHVRAGTFTVDVDDADVMIDATSVRVHRGIARITRDGKLAEIAAGASWPPEPVAQVHVSSTATLLKRARGQFAAKQYTDAERTLDDALSRSLSRADEIAARVLLADIAQAAGKLELATTRYTDVATKFVDAPAAESALYAAARLEARRSHPSEAKRLLSLYLARYPAGRFTSDVRRELASIP